MSRIVYSPESIISNFLLFQRDTLQFLENAREMGDVVHFKTGNLKPSYVINAPDFIQEILVTKDAYLKKGRAANVLRRTIGDGLLTTEGDTHKRQRALMMPVFYKERIERYGRMMIEESEKMVARWQDGQTIMLNDEMMKLTLSIITRTMFGEEIDEDRKMKVANAVNETIARSAKLLYSPIMMPMTIPTPGNLRHKRALELLDQLIDEILQHLDEQPELYETTLIGLLTAVRDENGKPLPRREIRDQMMTMLIAGHETTANALSWAWYLLHMNQQSFETMRAEARSVVDRDKSAMEMYRSLPYTQKVVQETLRMYPPAWIILREVDEKLEILGETFVKGSSLLICPYALHRNPEVFDVPLAFRPERFDGTRNYPKFAYFPFGGGSRSCIGSTFALMEATLILATVSVTCRLELISDWRPKPDTSVSLRMKQDMQMIVRK